MVWYNTIRYDKIWYDEDCLTLLYDKCNNLMHAMDLIKIRAI